MSKKHGSHNELKPEEARTNAVTRRAFMASLSAASMGVMVGAESSCGPSKKALPGPTLENGSLSLDFDGGTGLLVRVRNKLTNEAWDVRGDDFFVEALEFTLTPENTDLESLRLTSPELLEATYRARGRTVTVTYQLGQKNHFVEKRLTLSSTSDFGLKNLVVGKYVFAGAKLELIKYTWLHNVVYFGRSAKGGLFLGVELPFDRSSLSSEGMVTLGYAPSLKVGSKQSLVCEPVYLGVYEKEPDDAPLSPLGLAASQMAENYYKREFGDKTPAQFPLRSEWQAMVAMTSAILGPPRERLAPIMDGWESEMTYAPYETPADVEGEMRSIDFAAECGMGYVAGGAIWGGAVNKVVALRDDDKLQLGDFALQVAAHARQKGLGWQLWQCVTNANPWETDRNLEDGKRPYPAAQPYRPDKPDWLMSPTPDGKEVLHGNCFGHQPFFEWFYKTVVEALDGGQFTQWMVDGDFFGGGGLVEPVNCTIAGHDHLPGDSNYACERNLIEMARRLRERYPDIYMFWERPGMDLGVWMMRHVDASFTVDETSRPISLPGVGAQPLNCILGDKIRTWSRLRVQMQFLPHYLDQPLPFPEPPSMRQDGHPWESAGLDYIILSTLACAPNGDYYLPSKSGIPQSDKQTIKKWLDWGRENIHYLMVRKDLPDWPGAGKVDGFAHIVGDRGFVFLFNPNSKTLQASFALDKSIGLTEGTKFNVASVHPTRAVKHSLALGGTLTWQVPSHGAVLLEITAA